jgi:hypothetical protein
MQYVRRLNISFHGGNLAVKWLIERGLCKILVLEENGC